MRAKSYAEVREVLALADFRAWFDELCRTTQAQRDAAERFDELLTQSTLLDFRAELAQKNAIDTLYQAGECEDQAARLNAESEGLENRSFEAVARFESHRVKVSEVWYRLGALEKTVQELRDRVERAREAIRGASGDSGRQRELDVERGQAEQELNKREAEHRQVEADYQRETQHKEALWNEVEQLWQESAEKSLLLHEKEVQGRKVRKRAERLFREAEDRKLRSRKLRTDADEQSVQKGDHQRRLTELLRDARERFGCAVGEEFLYFRQREHNEGIYAVSLIADSDSYNIEVKPLGLYRVDRQHGVSLLAPASEPQAPAPAEKRFEEFFLSGREKS
jgi:hypothetical protein